MLKKIIKKYKSLSLPVKAALWYTICNIFNKGLALLSTPIFTRLLTSEQYGTFALFQSWFNILIIFTSLNIFLSGYTKGLLLFKGDEDSFTSTQLSLTSFITLIFFLIFILDVDFWCKTFDLPLVFMFALFIELFITPARDFWMARERFNYKYKNVVIVSILMNFLCLSIAIITVILLNNKLEARIFSDVFVKLIFSIVIFIMIIIKGKKLYNKKYWVYALKFNIPLIPHYLSNYILSQSDRIMIGKMVGKTQAAFYSVSYTISTMMLLITTAINNSFTPYLYKSLDSKNTKRIKDVTVPIAILISSLCIITMAFAPEIIRVFAGAEYLEAIYVIPPVSVSVYFMFCYLLYSNIEYFYQKTGFIALATTISAILNIILNYVGIKIFGYYAAGYTTLICYAVLSIVHYVFYKRVLKNNAELKTDDIFPSKMIFFISIVLIILMILITILYSLSLFRYLIILVMIIILVIKKKEIINGLKKIRKDS